MSSYVSIVIPTYNRKAYIQEAIDSALAQTYSHYEIIVIDDGSTDGTGEALAARYGDKIRYVWQENQGESAARNHGIQLSTGKYVALLDSDDLWYPQKLSRQIDFLTAHPDIGLLTCLMESMDVNGITVPGQPGGIKALQFGNSFAALYRENILSGASSAVIPKQIIERGGGFDEDIRFGEDWDFWLRIAAITEFYCLPHVLVRVRIHEGGQWFFPKPERTTKHLNDHLKIIQKGYDIWPDRPSHAGMIRDKKIGEQYARATVEYFAFNEPLYGRDTLNKAVEFDFESWTDFASFKPMVLQLTRRLEENKALPAGNGIPVVRRVVQQLSGSGIVAIQDPVVAAAEILLETGYHFSAIGEKRRALRYLTVAIRMTPQRIRDRGVQLELIKNTLGHSTAQWTRETFRKFRGRAGSTV